MTAGTGDGGDCPGGGKRVFQEKSPFPPLCAVQADGKALVSTRCDHETETGVGNGVRKSGRGTISDGGCRVGFKAGRWVAVAETALLRGMNRQEASPVQVLETGPARHRVDRRCPDEETSRIALEQPSPDSKTGPHVAFIEGFGE